MGSNRFGAVAGRIDRLWLLGIGILTFIVLLPTLLVPIPPLVDYPNHLVRIWLLGGGLNQAPMNQFYAEDWHGIIINVGLDLAAKLFGAFIPPMILGRILIALAVLLPPIGAVMLNRAAFGRYAPWQWLFFFFWGCETMLAGFLSFQIGLGLALLAAASDMAFAAPPARKMLVRALVTAGLIAIHPAAPFFYCVLLAGIGFGAAPLRTRALAPRLIGAVQGFAVVLIAMIAYISFAHAVPTTQGHMVMAGGPREVLKHNSPIDALAGVISPFIGYDYRIDILFALPLAAFVVHAAWRGKFRVHAGLLTVATLLIAASFFMPSNYHGTGWIDRRLPIMAVLTALAAVMLKPAAGRRARFLMPAMFGLWVGLRTLWLGLNWQAGTAMIHSMQTALAELPAGAKVLAMQHLHPSLGLDAPGRHLGVAIETYRHHAMLAMLWRHAFVPNLFAQAGMHPITIRQAYQPIADPAGGILSSVHALDPGGMQEYLRDQNRYAPLWRTHFDYVLVLNADMADKYGPFTPPAALELAKDAGFARLYRIHREQ